MLEIEYQDNRKPIFWFSVTRLFEIWYFCGVWMLDINSMRNVLYGALSGEDNKAYISLTINKVPLKSDVS